MIIVMDAPEHSAARRAVVGEFTVKRMVALRPRCAPRPLSRSWH